MLEFANSLALSTDHKEHDRERYRDVKGRRNCVVRIATLGLLVMSAVLSNSFAFADALPKAVSDQSSGQSHGQPSDQPSSQLKTKTILFIGDSITAGYGVKKDEGYPEQIGLDLNSSPAKKFEYKIVNGGISGSVTADADRRVRWYLKLKPDVLVLALGGNDALKGTKPEVIKKNLAAAIDMAQANQLPVLLCGIQVYSNFGEAYNRDLQAAYVSLAKEKKVPLMPFLLVDVAMKSQLNQSDMKHPNAKGHAIVAKNVEKYLEKLL